MTQTEQQEMAARTLLSIARDDAIRPAMRIHAAKAVLLGESEPMPYEDDSPPADAVSDDVYDAIAERVVLRLRAEGQA